MAYWTRETVLAWARKHLPAEFRACHVGVAAREHLGHWTHGGAIMSNLRKFGLVEIVTRERYGVVEHAYACQGRSGGYAYRLIAAEQSDAERERDAHEARVLLRLDEPATAPEDPRIQRLRDMCDL